jgi:hypothetical protein
MSFQIRVDLTPGNTEQRADDGELFADGNLPDAAESNRPGAAKQIQQKRFDEIASVVAKENRATTAAAGDARKEFIARVSPSGLDRLLRSPGQRGYVNARDLAFQVQFSRERLDEFRIGVA